MPGRPPGRPTGRRRNNNRQGQPGQQGQSGQQNQQSQPNQPNPQNPQNRQNRQNSQRSGRSKSDWRPGQRGGWNSTSNRQQPSVPIHTNRGIKARSQRGTFSKNWWARSWIEAMELLVDPHRLQRGRSYARQGQVLSIQENEHGVEAKVQGSRPQPYKVSIQVKPLTDAQWNLVIDAMAEQALFTAQLLAGEMPENIEDAFQTAGVSLFPQQSGDLFTECSCPDWANPCKHVAATHYILGDRFDDDPFLLFRMRGRSQDQILQALRARRSGDAAPEAHEQARPEPVKEQSTPLEAELGNFWDPAESLDTFPLTIRPPSVDMPLLKRLGEPAFFTGESMQELLKPVYDIFTRSALRAAYSEEEPLETSNGNGNGNEDGSGNGNGHDTPEDSNLF